LSIFVAAAIANLLAGAGAYLWGRHAC
jgi:hypothetical protein